MTEITQTFLGTKHSLRQTQQGAGLSNGRISKYKCRCYCCTIQSSQSHAPHYSSITLALTNNARQTKQNHCLNKIVPRRLKMRVHSVPRCSYFYRHFPALCLLQSNPPNAIPRHTAAAQCCTATTGWALLT